MSETTATATEAWLAEIDAWTEEDDLRMRACDDDIRLHTRNAETNVQLMICAMRQQLLLLERQISGEQYTLNALRRWLGRRRRELRRMRCARRRESRHKR